MTYRIGFALTTALGNKSRYINLRKYADRDPEVQIVWAPIKHYLENDPYTRFPGPIHTQLVLNHEARAILEQLNTLDAVVVHAFQLFSYLSLYRLARRRPLLVWYQDYAPIRDLQMLQTYGHRIGNARRRKLRYRIESWFTRRADLYFPWSDWAKNSLIHDCSVVSQKIHTLNIGVDLEIWPYVSPISKLSGHQHILFVGGDFERKGGRLLLDVFEKHFSDRAHLDIVTSTALADLPRNVTVYNDLVPNDQRLRQLYARSDIFALPTKADMSSIASIEAMATGRPVISTAVGGIPSLIKDGCNGFLINPDDANGLRERLELLLGDVSLQKRMGENGRKLVESELNAEVGAQRMLSIIKRAISERA
jgi:glycosyltransferase involved in cell wall biosynthesis